MPTISLIRNPSLTHHVIQGTAWLDSSAGGTNTAALAYAAFEFRLAIERLATQYWALLLDREIEVRDLSDIRSFKQIERRIYELGGHQKVITKHFEFIGVLFDLLKIQPKPVTPNIGELSKNWHQCSELCHVGWSLSCSDPELATKVLTILTEVQKALTIQTSGLVGWPKINDDDCYKLRKRFICGQANADDVHAYLKKTGIWAKVIYNDGRASEFVGEAVPPTVDLKPYSDSP